jgi:DNA helicase-2/ATP-dependent DNA helicase PcrA
MAQNIDMQNQNDKNTSTSKIDTQIPLERFLQSKKMLNEAQLQAVEQIDGPVMVMAGPGTGKTQVLATRIAEILHKTDTRAYQILALTFTESAAITMRRRLVKMIGRTGYYVQIMTFHAFCSGVMQEHPEYFDIDRESAPLSQLERYEIFEQLLQDKTLKLDLLKPLKVPLLYLPYIISAISDLKREDVSPDALEVLLENEQNFLTNHADMLKKAELSKRQTNLKKQTELLSLYRAYQTALQERNRYDFDDMIRLVGEVFTTNEELLLEYQETLQYFLVDEYQDTNAAQNKVVDALASHWGDQANIFVVGDPNQAIYRFQGASVENALGFVDRYKHAVVITLTQGYRCPQAIYDAAAGVIAHNQLNDLVSEQFPGFNRALDSQKKRDLPAKTGKSPTPITIAVSPNESIEIWSIVEQIESLLASGVSAHEVAVLYYHNRDALSFQLALSRKGIRYDIEGGDDVLQDERIRQFLTLLKVIEQMRPGMDDQQDPAAFFEVLSYDWVAIDNVLVYELAHKAAKEKKTIMQLMRESASDAHFVEKYASVLEFTTLLQTLSQADFNKTFPEWFVDVLEKSGYRSWVMQQPEKIEHLINMQSLYAQVKDLSAAQRSFKLKDFLHAIELMETHHLPLSAEDFSMGDEAVRLSTVHKAKGGEWQYVFIVHCVDEKWGNGRKKNKLPLPDGVLKNTQLDVKERNEDDRRLFYVALTRASEQVTVSYALSKVSGTRAVETVQSMFVEELKSVFAEGPLAKNAAKSLSEVVIEPPAESIISQLEAVLSPAAPSVFAMSDAHAKASQEAFFASLVESFTLSVTALNSYLRDPEQFVLNTLLRIPRAKESHLAFGTAIHSALEFGFKHAAKTDVGAIQAQFEAALQRELLTQQDYQRWLLRGKEVLQIYFDQVNFSAIQPFQFEKSFGYGKAQTILDDITLSGRIDRIDWIDQDLGTVKVIDYKTGSSKSVNEIEGAVASKELSDRERALPESIRGPLKRQLLFYKLLTELDQSFKPVVTHGVFEFVEPNKSGKIVTRLFELHQEDVDLLKELIKEVMAEIRSLKFLS